MEDIVKIVANQTDDRPYRLPEYFW